MASDSDEATLEAKEGRRPMDRGRLSNLPDDLPGEGIVRGRARWSISDPPLYFIKSLEMQIHILDRTRAKVLALCCTHTYWLSP